MEPRMNDIHAPVAKGLTALGVSGGTSIANVVAERSSFLPQTLGEYLAAGSAGLAMLYTMVLFAEWFWKKVIKGRFGQ